MLQHPGLQLLLFFLLAPWPLIVVYRRVGLSPAWVLLLAGGLVVPYLGLLLALMPLTFKAWPKFPKAPPPRLPVKADI